MFHISGGATPPRSSVASTDCSRQLLTLLARNAKRLPTKSACTSLHSPSCVDLILGVGSSSLSPTGFITDVKSLGRNHTLAARTTPQGCAHRLVLRIIATVVQRCRSIVLKSRSIVSLPSPSAQACVCNQVRSAYRSPRARTTSNIKIRPALRSSGRTCCHPQSFLRQPLTLKRFACRLYHHEQSCFVPWSGPASKRGGRNGPMKIQTDCPRILRWDASKRLMKTDSEQSQKQLMSNPVLHREIPRV